MIEIPINDLNKIIIYITIIGVVMAILLICNFNMSRKKIRNTSMNRF